MHVTVAELKRRFDSTKNQIGIDNRIAKNGQS